MVNAKSDSKIAFMPIWKGHLAVVGILFITTVVVIVFVIPKYMNEEPFSDILAVQKTIQDSGLVHTVGVKEGKSWGTNLDKEEWESTYFIANAVLKHRPSDYDEVLKKIASIVFDTFPRIMEKNTVVISGAYGYDIGIANSWRSHSVQHTPVEWKQLLLERNLEE